MSLGYVNVYPFTNEKAHFLYELLQERMEEPNTNISHTQMPKWDEHCAFIHRNPYHAWYLILTPTELVRCGAIYLSKRDEIGVHLKREYRGKGYGPEAVKWLMDVHTRNRYYANINPRNIRSLQMFEKLGFGDLQITLVKQ